MTHSSLFITTGTIIQIKSKDIDMTIVKIPNLSSWLELWNLNSSMTNQTRKMNKILLLVKIMSQRNLNLDKLKVFSLTMICKNQSTMFLKEMKRFSTIWIHRVGHLVGVTQAYKKLYLLFVLLNKTNKWLRTNIDHLYI